MAPGAHDMIDRRHLRRKLGRWRVLALLAVAAAVLAGPLAAFIGEEGSGSAAGQIARVEVAGLITEDRDLVELLDDLRRESRVRAVVVAVNSPGGTTVGGETIYEAIRALAGEKPVVAEIGTLGASAGYMVASAADHLVAHQSSIVGSIGVIFQYVDASVLLGRIGVDVEAVRSSPLKAEPSPFAPAPPEARAMIDRMVRSSYEWFVALVAERRDFPQEEAFRLADGSVFTGVQALSNGLVDALGGESEARRWLEEDRAVPRGLPIVEREPDRDRGPLGFLGTARAALFGLAGLDPLAGSIGEALFGARPQLDGLVSLWQPSMGDPR